MNPTLLTSLVAASAACVSAVFAAITWNSWRSQFKLTLPYVSTSYVRLLNGHLIKWSVQGRDSKNWSVANVTVKGNRIKLAYSRVYSFPISGRGSAGHIEIIGTSISLPTSDLLIVGHDGPVRAILNFTVKSNANPKLRIKSKQIVDLVPLPKSEQRIDQTSKLFSGEIKIDI